MEGEATRILIVDDNREFCILLQDWIAKEPDLVCVGTIYDGRTAVKKIPEMNPDIVILDLVLPHLDGLGVLERMRQMGVTSKFLILSAFGADHFVETALKLGADSFVMKPFEPPVLMQRIREIVRQAAITDIGAHQDSLTVQQEKAVVEEMIAHRITEIGIPAHYKGYRYLKDGISMVIDDVELLGQVTKVLYPAIAERNKTSPEKVERAMRHAIETAWSRGDVEVLHRTFGYSVDASRGRPTNSSFIAKLADQIRLELRAKGAISDSSQGK
ncbi:MAG: sporulation transcription factor Spo0A [Firmicutes bacterium]|jgi:two-component system response regulator (stage 0 sporulation protein A)|nr:sporulation transcription factor Spo0A [Bacillota bacterium]